MAGPKIVARAEELESIAEFARVTTSGPGMLLLTGEAGIGKTTLWAHALEAARSDRTVLLARPVEQDAGTPYVGVADLLHPHLDTLDGLLTSHDRAVIAQAVLDGTAQPRLLRQAFRAAVRSLADQGPTLIAVDDVQWLDEPTARLLAHAVGHLTREPVGIMLTARTDPAKPGHLADVLRAAAAATTTWLDLTPLPAAALIDLVHDRTGIAVPETVMRRVHMVSGGNPLFTLELARAWEAAGRPPELHVPDSLVALLAESLSSVSPPTGELLEAAATVGRATAARLAQMLGRDVDRELEDAVGNGLLTVDRTGDIRFAHPLHAFVTHQATPWARRTWLHREASKVVTDPVERARHLALATSDPSPTVASALDAAAEQAARRGSPETAAELAREAGRLTAPQDRGARHDRSLALGMYLDACGRFKEAIAEFEELLAAPDLGPRRALVLLARAALEDDVGRRRLLTTQALDERPEDAVAARAHNQLAWYEGFLQLRLDEGIAHATQALEAARRADDGEQLDIGRGRLAHLLALSGRPDRRLLDATPRSHALVAVDDRPELMLALQCMWRGDLATAQHILEEQYAAAARMGDDSARPYLLVHLVDLAVRRGAGADVVWLAEERRRATLSQHEYGGVLGRYVDASVAAYAGPTAGARERASAAITKARELGIVPAELRLRHALGQMCLLDGEPTAAWDALRPAYSILVESGVGEPGFVPVLPDVVTALVAVGDLTTAEAAAAMLRDAAETGHPWAASAALHCAGMVALARGDTEDATRCLWQARDAFSALGFRHMAARSTYEAGTALRRAGQRREAQLVLSDAVRQFRDMGASVWAVHAGRDLGRAQARRCGGGLTAGEERIAALVAAGRSNRQVAAELFVSIATVEATLTRVYRKLGVSTRTQLARSWAQGRTTT